MKIIVCVESNWGIGRNNQLLCKVAKDMEFFKQMTVGKTVVMGHNTLLSLPNGPLPNRKNLVFSRNRRLLIAGAQVIHSPEDLAVETGEIFVIGGEQIYKLLLPFCNTAYVTKLLQNIESDAYFPNLDAHENWQMTQRSQVMTDNNVGFIFTKYERMN